MTAAWLAAQEIITKPSPTNSKRLIGTVETMIKTIRRCLEKGTITTVDRRGHMVNTLSSWPEEAAKAMKDANHRHISTLGFSPAQIKLGLLPQRLSDRVEHPSVRRQALINAIDGIDESPFYLETNLAEGSRTIPIIKHLANRQHIQVAVRRAEHRTKQLNQARFNKRHAAPPTFSISDTILLMSHHLRQKSKQPPWSGLFRITGHTPDSNHCFMLSSISGKSLQGNHHADDLRLFTPRTGYLAFGQEPLPAPRTLPPAPPKDNRPKSKKMKKRREFDALQPPFRDTPHDHRQRDRATRNTTKRDLITQSRLATD
ncbi:hypothetical protein TI39_contig5955g00001 [Zymoseptoria brevis]|uniref:Uncharacterized protein n=1 Tax=Zymoseptoria brevis TaxID=1047168 RepID=A0A0F4G3W9_9PEZI|nr:hypothetical protein TI39_contig5955g00001 [Zymoseptoria brevis]